MLCLFLSFLLSANGVAASQQIASGQKPVVSLATSNYFKQLLASPLLLKNLKTIERKNKLIVNPPLLAAEKEDSGIPAGEDLILSLSIQESAYSDLYVADLFALKSSRNAKLSLISLFEVLDFPINVDAKNKRVSGWFLKEDNHFEMKFPREINGPITVIINGVKRSLTADSYLILDDDIFVEAENIAQWFAFEFEFNYSDLKVNIRSQTPLPIQLALARKNRKKATRYNNQAVFPWKETGYQAVSTPLIDLQLNSSKTQSKQYSSYSLLSVQDMAYLTSELYVNGNSDDSLNNARLTFSKEDNSRQLFGPLQASRYQLGDITAVKMANSSTGSERRGLRFSNHLSHLATDNKTTTISGNIQAGWDAELYRNGLFVDQQINIQDGRYDFRDVVLLFGENRFEVIQYGPQGQVQQSHQYFYIDSNMLKNKQSVYDISISQVNKSLLGVSKSNGNEAEGWETAGVFSKGITDNLSLKTGGAYFFNKEGEDIYQYSFGGSYTPFKQLLLSSDFQQDNQKNESISISGRTLLAGQSFSLSYLHNQSHPEASSATSSERYNLIMSGQMFPDSLVPISYQNEWAHYMTDLGNDNKVFTNQVAFRASQFSVANKLFWVDDTLNGEKSNRQYGSFELQRSFAKLYTRFLSGYRLSPNRGFTQVQGEFSYPLSDKINSSLKLKHSLDNKKSSAKLGLNWSFDSILFNSTASYNSDDEWSIGLFTSFGFGYEPTTNQFFMAKGSLARSGALVARVFEDANLNGKFDDGEHLLEGVKVKALQSYQQEKTDKNGVAVLKNLAHGRKTDIVIDTKTVEDPFIIPLKPGVSITSRKGFIEVLDIPMVNAGELEGTVYLKDNNGNESLGAYLGINVHNSEGKLVATTETEFDGYYLFTDLVPGQYKVSIAAEDLKRKNLHDAKALEFTLGATGDVIAGADFAVDRYTFVNGYVVELGTFNSLAMLKAYWQIIKEKYNNTLQQQVFYSENKAQQTLQLNAAFFKGKAQAARACNYLQEKEINCSVKEFEFNL